MLESIWVRSISDVHLIPPPSPVCQWVLEKPSQRHRWIQASCQGPWQRQLNLVKEHFHHGCHISITLKAFSHRHQWKQLSHCSLTPLTQDLEWELCAFLNSARRSTVLTLLPLSHEALHCNSYQILKYPPKNQEKSCFLEADWTPFWHWLSFFCFVKAYSRTGRAVLLVLHWNSGVRQTDGNLLLTSPTQAFTESSFLSFKPKEVGRNISVFSIKASSSRSFSLVSVHVAAWTPRSIPWWFHRGSTILQDSGQEMGLLWSPPTPTPQASSVCLTCS